MYTGDTVHLTMVTPTPYGAGSSHSSASISCFRSSPDSSTRLSFGRPFQIALPGTTVQTSTTLPTDSSQSVNGPIVTRDLTTSNDATGLFYCEGSNRGLTTRVYSIIHNVRRRFKPADGLVTKTVNKGEDVTFSTDYNEGSGYAPIWNLTRDGRILPGNRQLNFTVPSTDAVDGDLYTVFGSGVTLADNHFSMMRLIVRGCVADKWGPSDCKGVCDLCYNGGVCDDETGDCICPPGFNGTNCLTACGRHRFGWRCEFQCGPGNVIRNCTGSQFGLPDPYGNSCISGYHGVYCLQECSDGSFGAGCTQTCHCQSGQCNRYTGNCEGTSSRCGAGWKGTNCQIPDVCRVGYYGENCLRKCHCFNDAACDKDTGYCRGSGGVCATGLCPRACLAAFYWCNGAIRRFCRCLNNAPCHLSSRYCWECEAGFQADNNGQFNEQCSTEADFADFSDFQVSQVSKTNPGQSVEFRCTVTSVNLLADQAILLSTSAGGSGHNTFRFRPYNVNGEWTYINSVPGLQNNDNIYCIVTIGGYSTTTSLLVTFYVLPVLSRPPNVTTVTSTSATVSWQAWDSDVDAGDGPVIAYTVYSLASTTSWMAADTVTVADPRQTMYSFTVQPLNPSTGYMFSVSAVREGPGGEGPRSRGASTLTLPKSPSSPTTSGPITTESTRLSTKSIIESTSSFFHTAATSAESTTLTELTTPVKNTPPIVYTTINTEASRESPPSVTIMGLTTTESTTSSTKSTSITIKGIEKTQPENTPMITQPTTNIEVTTTTQPPNSPNLAFIVIGVIAVVVLVLLTVAVVFGIYFLHQSISRQPVNTRSEGRHESQHTSNEVVAVNVPSPNYEVVGLPSWAQRLGIPWEDMVVGKKVLGKGSFGEVRDGAVMVGGEVPKAAIKTLKANASANDQQHFMEEFRTLTKIGRHPNVVSILAACQHEDILYVALELMPNGDLRTYLRNARSMGDNDQSTLSSEKLIQFALDVARGMQHLATLGVIHRDLAARNIFLNNRLVAKISGFGLSRGGNQYIQMSKTRVPIFWLSLESLSSKIYTTKSDVWSFGVLLWEIATLGETPYQEIEWKTLLQRLESGYRMPKPRNSDDEVYNLMLLCWQEDPANRPNFKKLVTRLTRMTDNNNDHTYMSSIIGRNDN